MVMDIVCKPASWCGQKGDKIYTEKNEQSSSLKAIERRLKNLCCQCFNDPIAHERQSLDMLPVNRLRAVDGDGSTSGAEVTLGSHNLVVVLTELHALAGPRIEVGLHVDASAGALVLANRPVLLKGRGAVNGRLVGAGALRNLVRGAVGGDGALVLRLRRRVVRAEVLDNVVLDERVAGPAVDGEVGVTVGVVGARVGDGAGWVVRFCVGYDIWEILPSRSGVPALSTDKVAAAGPVHAVGSGVAVGVGDLGATIGPPGVVAAVVGASGRGGALAGNKVARRTGGQVSGGSGDSTGGSNSRGDDGGEGDHFEVLDLLEVSEAVK
jgi:hypothetical protein